MLLQEIKFCSSKVQEGFLVAYSTEWSQKKKAYFWDLERQDMNWAHVNNNIGSTKNMCMFNPLIAKEWLKEAHLFYTWWTSNLANLDNRLGGSLLQISVSSNWWLLVWPPTYLFFMPSGDRNVEDSNSATVDWTVKSRPRRRVLDYDANCG